MIIQVAPEFNTVEDFWSIYLHLSPPGEVNLRIDYHLFLGGIKPIWEDPSNKKGMLFYFYSFTL